SVGVVMRLDRRVPRSPQYIVRAPGYTLKVDQTSGVSYCLLDADGHRRHGRIQGTNFTTGFPGVERDGKWSFHYGMPCEFVWEGQTPLTVGSRSFSPDARDARLRYTFHDDRFTLELIPPSNPTAEMTVWLGNFDALGRPRHNGTQQASHLPIS